MITGTVTPASPKQVDYIRDLTAGRPEWQSVITGPAAETIFDVLGNVGSSDPKFITTHEASAAIKALLRVRPVSTVTATLKQVTSKFIDLQTALAKLHVGHYALPRKADGVIDFFEVIEREGKNGKPTRYLNRLLGCPGDWNREHLSVDLQAAAARAISGDWVAAAQAYATHFQTCAKCDAPLSHPRSRVAKIGPKCAKDWGWKW